MSDLSIKILKSVLCSCVNVSTGEPLTCVALLGMRYLPMFCILKKYHEFDCFMLGWALFFASHKLQMYSYASVNISKILCIFPVEIPSAILKSST